MLTRFYDIMLHFNDDVRLAAFAITEIKKTGEPKKIYYDLLNNDFKNYLDILEDIIMNYKDLKEFNETIAFNLDMMNSEIWSTGDFMTLEHKGWKLTKEGRSEK